MSTSQNKKLIQKASKDIVDFVERFAAKYPTLGLICSAACAEIPDLVDLSPYDDSYVTTEIVGGPATLFASLADLLNRTLGLVIETSQELVPQLQGFIPGPVEDEDFASVFWAGVEIMSSDEALSNILTLEASAAARIVALEEIFSDLFGKRPDETWQSMQESGRPLSKKPRASTGRKRKNVEGEETSAAASKTNSKTKRKKSPEAADAHADAATGQPTAPRKRETRKKTDESGAKRPKLRLVVDNDRDDSK